MTASAIDPRALRGAFGAFITGVTVVTARGAQDLPIGFTANSFSSVSLDPPLLSVCLAKSSSKFDCMTSGRGFAINVLSQTQKDISNTFARRVDDRFADVDWQWGPNGAPIFPKAAAWFDCSLHQTVDAGDHVILIGRVEGFEDTGHNGLGYARGNYFTPALATQAVEAAAAEGTTEIGAVVESAGSILLVDKPGGKIGLPCCAAIGRDPVRELVRQIKVENGVSVEIGFLFSVYEERSAGRQHIVYRGSVTNDEPSSGRFYPAADIPFDRFDRPQSVDIVRRFCAENELGQFAVYIGNEVDGRVHRLQQEA